MPGHARSTKVFVAALISALIGGLTLKALCDNPPSAGAFSLSEYYRLDSIEEVLRSDVPQSAEHWGHIVIYYSGSIVDAAREPEAINGTARRENTNCHFVIFNGVCGGDGQIQTTEKWRRQSSAAGSGRAGGKDGTIRLSILADGKIAVPTNLQIKRTESLVAALARRFNICSEFIHYPEGW